MSNKRKKSKPKRKTLPILTYKNVNEGDIVSKKEINLTEDDRITYIYKRDKKKEIVEVTNVSYEIKTNNQWITIVRYDSSHGYLHRHIVISLTNPSDTISTEGVKKKGTHAHWLTWAVKDIKERYKNYKRGFLKRSKIKDIDI